MQCPSCEKPAATFLRYAFSSNGVSYLQSLKGYLRCAHCSTLLKIIQPNRVMLIVMTVTVIYVSVYVLFAQQIISFLGIRIANMLFIPLLLAIVFCTLYIEWRSLTIVKADTSNDQ